MILFIIYCGIEDNILKKIYNNILKKSCPVGSGSGSRSTSYRYSSYFCFYELLHSFLMHSLTTNQRKFSPSNKEEKACCSNVPFIDRMENSEHGWFNTANCYAYTFISIIYTSCFLSKFAKQTVAM